MAIRKFSPLLAENPLCGIGEYKDVLDLSTGGITRRVKKLVLTGEESWKSSPIRIGSFYYEIKNDVASDLSMCDRAVNASTISDYAFGKVYVERTSYSLIFLNIWLFDTNISVADFKSYLATQYAAGTPVTVWYVLATPETETITVPSGLTGTIEGYLTQSGTPTPSAPIYPEANPALVWTPTTYRKYGTETDTITSLPAQIIGDGQPITSCQISGNTIQDGTPTPEDPVDVVGFGARTVQLFEDKIASCSIDAGGRLITNPDFDMYIAKVEQGVTYTASEQITGGFYTTKPVIGSVSYNGQRVAYVPATITAPITGYMTFRVNSGGAAPMLNSGATPLPYEPYGYKLPLTVNGTEHPIYLGQVQTTRRLKKIVFDGTEEGWEKSATRAGCFALRGFGTGVVEKAIYCTHATYVSTASQLTSNNTCYMGNDFNIWLDLFNAQTTNEQFKSYLAAQYANGTPVTIWYVLATPETGIVNEPLMKIADYADTVTVANVPTTGTPENLDVGTTLKPSEVSLTYHGWHEHEDTKFMQGE